MQIFWMYELKLGQGVYQGSTGPGAEGTVRRVVQMTKDEQAHTPSRFNVPPGDPFMAYVPEVSDNGERRADDLMLKDAGFSSPQQLLESYRLLAEVSNMTSRKVDALVERLTEARTIARKLNLHSAEKVSDVLSDEDFSILRKLAEGKL